MSPTKCVAQGAEECREVLSAWIVEFKTLDVETDTQQRNTGGINLATAHVKNVTSDTHGLKVDV